MANTETLKMLEKYTERVPAPLFLSSLFKSPKENFHNSEKVVVDVVRSAPDIAIPIPDLQTNPRYNAEDVYTSKEIAPPILDEAGTVNSGSLTKRQAGDHPYMDADNARKVMQKTSSLFTKLSAKVQRSTELMASQVLQEGRISLPDDSGNEIYGHDFQPKSSHFPNASVTWGSSGDDPLKDLGDLAKVLRRDGNIAPNVLIFGSTAFDKFISNDEVKERLDNRRYDIGEYKPILDAAGEAAHRQGTITIGAYRFEIWLYDSYYRDPATKQILDYVAPDNVIMLSNRSRFDLTFGGIPLVRTPDPEAL